MNARLQIKKGMRVLQLIDSLRIGGAEKMAVSYANTLVDKVEGSYLCSTRLEGFLKEELDNKVHYLFLNRKRSLDLIATLKLKKFIRDNKIDIVQAHGSSFLIAVLVKVMAPNFKLIWHVHNGASEKMQLSHFLGLKFLSFFFDGVISVNTTLEKWVKKELRCKKVIELPNFITNNSFKNTEILLLKGDMQAFKIICVANIRPEKDYYNLLDGFEKFAENKNVSLHIIGNDFNTEYSKQIFKKIDNSKVKNQIFYYGSQRNVLKLLEQAHLGVIPSRSEGLPVALLEYGIVGLCVVSTDVGQCKNVIKNNGLIVRKEDSMDLAEAFNAYYCNKKLAISDASKFNKNIISNYSPDAIISRLISFYESILISN